MSIDHKAAMDRVRALHPSLRLQVLAGLLGGCSEAFKYRGTMTEEGFVRRLESSLQMCEKANAEHQEREAKAALERPHQALGRIARERGEGL